MQNVEDRIRKAVNFVASVVKELSTCNSIRSIVENRFMNNRSHLAIDGFLYGGKMRKVTISIWGNKT